MSTCRGEHAALHTGPLTSPQSHTWQGLEPEHHAFDFPKPMHPLGTTASCSGEEAGTEKLLPSENGRWWWRLCAPPIHSGNYASLKEREPSGQRKASPARWHLLLVALLMALLVICSLCNRPPFLLLFPKLEIGPKMYLLAQTRSCLKPVHPD